MCSIVLIHPSQFHLSICITAVIFNISEIVLWGRDVMRSDSSASASCLLGAHRPRRAGKSKQAPEDTGSGRRCLLSPGKLWLVAKKKKGICYINITASIQVAEDSAHFTKYSFREVHLCVCVCVCVCNFRNPH